MKVINNENVAEIQVSYKPTNIQNLIIGSSKDAFDVLKPFYSEELISLKESFVVIYINRYNKVIGINEVSSGGITGTVVDIRLVLGVALKVAATSIILAHNYPSGNLKPSRADEFLTIKIKKAAIYMDIQVSDHLILSSFEGYYSFADEGAI